MHDFFFSPIKLKVLVHEDIFVGAYVFFFAFFFTRFFSGPFFLHELFVFFHPLPRHFSNDPCLISRVSDVAICLYASI